MVSTNQIKVDILLALKGDKVAKSRIDGVTKSLEKKTGTTSKGEKVDLKAEKAIKNHIAALKKQENQNKKNIKETVRYSTVLNKLSGRYDLVKTKTKMVAIEGKKLRQVTSQQIVTNKIAIQTLLKRNVIQGQAAASLRAQTAATKGNVLASAQMNTMWGIGNPLIAKYNAKLNQVRWAMVNITFAVAGLAAVLSPIFFMTKFGVELETLFTRIAFVTGETMGTIESSIRDLRIGTQFSMDEMGTAFLEFTKQGFSATEALAAMPHIIALSVAGFTDLKGAVETVGQILFAFNLNISETARITDLLTAAANKSRTDVEGLATALSFVGTSASMIGVPVDRVIAALATLSNKGLSASKAGTSLNAMFTQLIDPSDQVRKQMEDLGVSFLNAEGKIIDLNEIMFEFAAILKRLPKEERLEFLTGFFQTRGARAVSGFLNDLEKGGKTLAEFTDEIDEAGIAQEGFALVSETAAARASTAWNDFKDVFVEASTGMKNVWAGLLEGMTSRLTASNIGKRLTESVEKGQISMDELKVKFAEAGIESDEFMFRFEQQFGEKFIQIITRDTEKLEIFRDILIDINRIPLPGEKGFIGPLQPTKPGEEGKTEAEIAIKVAAGEAIAFARAISKLASHFEDELKPAAQRTLEGIIKRIKEARDAAALIDPANIAFFDSLIGNVEQQIPKVIAMNEELERSIAESEKWKKVIDGLNKGLVAERKILSDLRIELSNVNKVISELSRPRFAGQLGIEKLISGAELFLKKQRLATFGITDAQAFLQNALAKSSQGYDKLLDSIDKVNQATRSGKEEYEAWKETIKVFIEETISAGNELGENVSETVGRFATLLLSTSRFTEEQGTQGQAVGLLRDAYDVHYGAMTDDVKFAIQAHKESQMTVHTTAAAVVADLRNQWVEQNRYTNAVSASEAAVRKAADDVDYAKKRFAELTETINDIKKAFEEMLKVAQQALALIAKGEGPGPGPTATASDLALAQQFAETGTGLDPEKNRALFGLDDFIMRPGQPAVAFNPNDTIVGTKEGAGQTITIGDIIVSGVSGDPNEIGMEIAKTIRREMRTF